MQDRNVCISRIWKGVIMQQLVDQFARKFYYLRLSITDVCNFRCTYCLPDGYKPSGRHEFLSLSEIQRISRAFAELGTEKVRITGGDIRFALMQLRVNHFNYVATARRRRFTFNNCHCTSLC